MRNLKFRNGLVGAVALALVLAGFWYFKGGNAATKGPRETAAPVRIAKVERRNMAVVEHTLGTVVANATVQVTARVQGTLDSAHFKEGQFVRKGDLLFQIDPRPFQAALRQAQAILQRDQALLENARRDKTRYQTLYRQHLIPGQLSDTSSTNADVLAADVVADKAVVDLAVINLGYTQIRSPIDGKTGPLLVNPGNMVPASSGSPLVTITQVKPVKLSFNLPQSDLPLIQVRLVSHAIPVSLDARDVHGVILSAPVDFTSNVISNQSGTLELRADFANADLSLLPGQLVNATVTLNDIPDALVVPHDAIDDGPSGPYVYTVVNGRAVQRDVSILFDDSKHVAVKGDLLAGDAVIVEGQLRVVPGAEVQVSPATGATTDYPAAHPVAASGARTADRR